MFLILFLIYIHKIFKQVEKKLLKLILLSFIDNLRFIILEILIKKIVNTLKKTKKINFK